MRSDKKRRGERRRDEVHYLWDLITRGNGISNFFEIVPFQSKINCPSKDGTTFTHIVIIVYMH